MTEFLFWVEEFAILFTFVILATFFALGLWTQTILSGEHLSLSRAKTTAFTLLGIFTLGMTFGPITHSGLWQAAEPQIEVWLSALAAPFLSGFGAKAQLQLMYSLPSQSGDLANIEDAELGAGLSQVDADIQHSNKKEP